MLSIQNIIPSFRSPERLYSAFFVIIILLLINLNAFAESDIKKEVIFFGYDDYTLTGEAKTKLDKFVSEFNKANNYRIKVTGYTDNKGNQAYNKKLSARRIESVINYLASHGVETKDIDSKNFGSTEGFSNSGDNENSFKLNRRVELSMYEPGLHSESGSDNDDSEKARGSTGNILTMDTKFIIKHELKKIASEKIKFEVPAEINEDESGKVNVVIDDDLVATLSHKLKNNTYKIFETINKIELNGLSLTANDMNITSMKENDSGKWVWNITPEESGLHTVTLVIALKFSTSNGTEDVISLPIMLKAVDIIDKPHFLSEVYRKGLFLIFILIIALGIFTMVSKKNKSINKQR